MPNPKSGGASPDAISQAAIDSVLSLVEAEGESLVQRVGEPLGALAKCSEHLQQVLAGLEADRVRRDAELRALLKSHGVTAPPPRGPEADSFFNLLSTRFLLLKVAEAQDLLRARYENAVMALRAAEPSAGLTALLAEVTGHFNNVRDGYERLERDLKAMGLEPERSP